MVDRPSGKGLVANIRDRKLKALVKIPFFSTQHANIRHPITDVTMPYKIIANKIHRKLESLQSGGVQEKTDPKSRLVNRWIMDLTYEIEDGRDLYLARVPPSQLRSAASTRQSTENSNPCNREESKKKPIPNLV
jgi:hypothetical protein